ncbi:MAG: disulfide reductase [Elusimicrobia bacterium GWC2_51_8]|nr:MAG: disulfide reductase [Elusimicrobia bacterium GWA2_51_34]OGR60728.1 MAG: disulfide reductase [Elusimicrobia bacterium GWC2_51_8]OGR86613.1 MAG: disulfide reductase [Elusimicrobia bacterium GWF2_52_66]HAF95061.1 disulfide reductase [Elusimicrobiota bacterium]HCE98469.1 disulfide reductase [Elusimicrobiota bacterium]
MKYQYFPGCSLKGTGRAYEESFLAVFRALGVEVKELEDWNCCGATAYMSVDETKSYALAGRNLAIAGRENSDVIAPCSACYLVLNKTMKGIQEHPELRGKVTRALKAAGLDYSDKVKVRHPLDVLVNDIGLEKIKKHVKNPLTGMKLAAYYGCQVVRPFATFDDQHNPLTMDKLIEASGAECVTWPLKTHCCGGSLTGTVTEAGLRMVYIILSEAKKRGAQAIVTPCPLCQFNLDGYQDQVASAYERVDIPVLYFTQVIGLAMGLSPRELGIKRGIASAKELMAGR